LLRLDNDSDDNDDDDDVRLHSNFIAEIFGFRTKLLARGIDDNVFGTIDENMRGMRLLNLIVLHLATVVIILIVFGHRKRCAIRDNIKL
jgi:hypothetical protein